MTVSSLQLTSGEPSEEANAHRVLFGQFGEAESEDFSEPLNDTESAGDYGYYSDSDLEEDKDPGLTEAPKQNGPAGGNLSDPFRFSPVGEKLVPPHGKCEEDLKKGKVIKIQETAFTT